VGLSPTSKNRKKRGNPVYENNGNKSKKKMENWEPLSNLKYKSMIDNVKVLRGKDEKNHKNGVKRT